MQQPTSNRVQEIRLIKNLPNLTLENTSKELVSPTISKQIGSPSEIESPTSKKKKMLSLKKAADVQLARTELNNYLDILDTKVYKLVQKHEAQFLVAYRNHIKKVRQQMEEIRNKALTNANSTVSQTEKIETLQKQLTIFREESLKLFEKVNEKEGTIYNLKTKINELESQKSFLERSLRELVKRNKQLEGLNYESEVKKSAYESSSQINDKEFFISRPQPEDYQDFKNMYRLDMNKAATTFTRSRPYTTAINSKASIRSRNHSIQGHSIHKNLDFIQQKEQIEKKIDELLSNQVNQKKLTSLKNEILKILLSSNDVGATSMARETEPRKQSVLRGKSFIESKTHAKSSELEQYFCKSIEAVRKQITRRRGLKNMNFYSEYANLSLTQFKKVDFFRLLELLLSHDKIIAALHRAIFDQKKQYL